jgi:hypothetical protein
MDKLLDGLELVLELAAFCTLLVLPATIAALHYGII